MTPDQAKQLLLRYRPGSADADDPEIAGALEIAARNSELSEWLETHTAFQKSARDELRQIRTPVDLKSKILASRPAIIPFWRRRELLALAASAAILLGGVSYWFSKSSEKQTFANFQSRMVGFALRTYEMDILTSDGNKVRDYLANHGAPADYSLTPALARMPVKGGGRLSWQNRPVGMVCFALPQNETLYLFVIDRALIPGKNMPDAPRIVPGNHLSTATWSDGRRIYMLAAHTDVQTLAKLADQRG